MLSLAEPPTEEADSEWPNTQKLCPRVTESELINNRRQEEGKTVEGRSDHEKHDNEQNDVR